MVAQTNYQITKNAAENKWHGDVGIAQSLMWRWYCQMWVKIKVPSNVRKVW